MSDRSRYAMRGIAASYINFGVSFALSMLFTPAVIALLGPVSYGIWKMLATSITQYLHLLEFGLSGAIVRGVAAARSRDDNAEINALASTGSALYLLLALLSILVSGLLALVIGPLLNIPLDLLRQSQLTMFLLGCYVAAIFLLTSYTAIIAGHERYDVVNLLMVLATVSSPLLGLLLAWAGLGLPALGFGSTIAIICSGLVARNFVRHNLRSIKIRLVAVRSDMAFKTLRFGGMVFLLNSGTLIITASDNLVIARILGVAAIAPYAIAYTLGTILLQLVFRSADVLLPVFTDLYTRTDMQALHRFYPQLLRFTLAISCALALAVIFVGPAFIQLWVPSVPFVGLETLILIVLFAVLQGALVHPAQVMLQGLGQIRAAAILTIIEALINVVLSIIFAQRLGIIGIPLGSVVGQLLISAWYLPWLTARGISLPFSQLLYDVLPRPLLAMVPAGLLGASIAAQHLQLNAGGRLMGFALVGVLGALLIGVYSAVFYLLLSASDRQFIVRKVRATFVR